MNCSEPVTHASQERFLERFRGLGLREGVILGCYAMAETTFALTHGRATDSGYLDDVGPDGRTLLAVPRYRSDGGLRAVSSSKSRDDGRGAPERKSGEIHVRSPFTFSGYLTTGADGLRSVLNGAWYGQGDLGYRVGEVVLRRRPPQGVMIVGGVNVFPNDVEELVAGVDGVVPGRAAVFSDWDPGLETERVTILFESHLDTAGRRRVAIEVRQRVLAAFQIANFETHVLDPGWLVKSTSGKMARSANRDKWRQLDTSS